MADKTGIFLADQLTDDMIEFGLDVAAVAAERANRKGNPPFGCVLAQAACGRLLIGQVAENEVNTSGMTAAHAEMLAVQRLELRIGRGLLAPYVLFSPIESCEPCFGTAFKAGVRCYVYGARSEPTASPPNDVVALAERIREEDRPTIIFSRDGLANKFRLAQVQAAREGGVSSISTGMVFGSAQAQVVLRHERL